MTDTRIETVGPFTRAEKRNRLIALRAEIDRCTTELVDEAMAGFEEGEAKWDYTRDTATMAGVRACAYNLRQARAALAEAETANTQGSPRDVTPTDRNTA